MKRLIEFINEASNKDAEIVSKCEEQYTDKWIEFHKTCVDAAYDPTTKNINNISDKDLENFIKDNEDKFNDAVKTKLSFANAINDKNVSELNKIHDNQRVWYSVFDPYVTSAGIANNGVDNRKGLFGMAEVIVTLYKALFNIGITKPGWKMADYEFDDIIKKIK